MGQRDAEATQTTLDKARRLLQEGADQLDRGEALDGPAVMEELHERLLRKAHGGGKTEQTQAHYKLCVCSTASGTFKSF